MGGLLDPRRICAVDNLVDATLEPHICGQFWPSLSALALLAVSMTG